MMVMELRKSYYKFIMNVPKKSEARIKKLALEFLRQQDTCVLATSNKDKVHAATILYLMDENDDIYFLTKRSSTKFKNIKKNSKISLVVYESRGFPKSVQIEGVAEHITDPKINKKIIEQFVENVWDRAPFLPPVFRLGSGGSTALLKVKMKRIQYFEDSDYPEQIILENISA